MVSHPTRRGPGSGRSGRLLLLAAVASLGVSLIGAGRPAVGIAAEPEASVALPLESSTPSASPGASDPVMPSESPAPAPSAPAVPPESSPPVEAPSVAPPPSDEPSAPPAAPSTPPGPTFAYPAHCQGWPDARRRADDLLVNRWQLGIHPVVTLSPDRSWTEDPFRERNWQFNDHSLTLVLSLLEAHHAAGEARYLERALGILQDWVADNPRTGARSIWAWNDHATAWRAIVLSCASIYLPLEPWLSNALELHGATLADPAFYVKHGNHALNQSLGLLEVGHVLGRGSWQALAVSRLSTLSAESIDGQGVTNEQSVGYQFYNFKQYRIAKQRIEAMGLTPPPAFSRISLMPQFLAWATLPNGEYETIGDTDREAAHAVPGTWAEYAATQGMSGPRPPDTVALYRAGYLFARSGWGDRRSWTDEVALSLRFGPARAIHGHDDAGSLTLYGFGSRLLVDPGKYTYNADPYRTWIVSRPAHNVVTVDGVAWNRRRGSDLLNHSRTATMVTARVRMTGNTGVSHVRGVTFSRNLNYVLVDDRLVSSRRRTYRQLWHLTEDARPLTTPAWFRTQRAGGNVHVRQLIVGGTTSRVVTGRTRPIQGWLAWEYGRRLPAPVVEVVRSGTNVRYLTLIVPGSGAPASSVSQLRVTSTGYSAVIRIGAKSERVVVNGSSTRITPLN